MKIRFNATCPVCNDEKPGAMQMVCVEGARTYCGTHGCDIGDSRELEIPSSVSSMLRALVCNYMMEISSFYQKPYLNYHDGDALDLNHRVHKIRAHVNWSTIEEEKTAAQECDMEALKSKQPMVAAIVTRLRQLGYIVKQGSGKDVGDEGTIRLRYFGAIDTEVPGEQRGTMVRVPKERIEVRFELRWWK